jgi:tRNA threonylcarbamoyl adenosine modification protein YeaZ
VSAPLTLVLETATPGASLGLAEGDGWLIGREFHSDRHHNALLFGPLAELLAGRRAEEIGLVLVGSGPGSYSGTRVGIAAAQGVALAAGCPVVALPSLLGLPAVGEGRECLFIGDARRGAFWTARSAGWELAEAPATLDADELVAQASAAVAAGWHLVTMEEPDRFPLPAAVRAALCCQTPAAERLWQAWRHAPGVRRAAWAAVPPQPIYLKPPHITVPRRPWLAPPPDSAPGSAPAP